MNKYIFAFMAVIAALTEVFIGRGLKTEQYKEKTSISIAAGDGTATCRMGVSKRS